MTGTNKATVGLGLSGGGSRAAAFHCGTLQALIELKILDRITVVSTVSGGSVFGGTWMTARADKVSDKAFIKKLKKELSKGFVGRSIGLKIFKVLLPGYSRTNLIAETFDKVLFNGKKLKNLPESPQLCINTTILNNGQVGKFAQSGFSAWGLYKPSANPSHHIPLTEFPVALAVAASAAFPVGLPPLKLKRKVLPKDVEFRGSLEGATTLALTDGGVLENLGIQTLLKSKRFGTWHIIVSDAGTKERQWNPDSLINKVRSPVVGALSGSSLERVMLVMNDKENRWARQQVIEELQSSWMTDAIRSRQNPIELQTLLEDRPRLPRRNVLFVRVNQGWESFFRSIPKYRMVELAQLSDKAITAFPSSAAKIEKFLGDMDIDLSRARELYQELGGDDGVKSVNNVKTNFTALSERKIDQLAAHAAWQIHASHAIYGI